jgi:guanylate kinase
VKAAVPEALLIFLVPPSLEDLFGRLKSRATESADELDVRQRNAALELARLSDYDHVLVNETGEVDRVAARIESIIAAERAAQPRLRTHV